MEWKFNESQNTMVITTAKIIKGQNDILYVSHDIEDGVWQFLDGGTVTEEDAKIVGLGEIANIDDTVLQIANLPMGSIAYRRSKKDSWNIKIESETQDKSN